MVLVLPNKAGYSVCIPLFRSSWQPLSPEVLNTLFCFFQAKPSIHFISLAPLSFQKPFANDNKSKTVPLIFGNLPTPPKATAFEMALSKYMQGVWANFAKNPQAGLPWPQYPSVAVLGTMNQTVTTVPAAELDTRCPLLDPFLELAPVGSS